MSPAPRAEATRTESNQHAREKGWQAAALQGPRGSGGERAEKVRWLLDEFNIAGEIAMPTMKVKRAAVMKRYEDVISALYAEEKAEL